VNVVVSGHPTSGATIVTVSGQLDIDTAAPMHAVFDQLRAQSVVRVVVDLSRLTFCDCTGLSALKLAHNYCCDAGGYLRLAALTPVLRQMLAVVGLAQALPAYPSVPAACAGDPAGLVPASGRQSAPFVPRQTRRGDRLPGNLSAGLSPDSMRVRLVRHHRADTSLLLWTTRRRMLTVRWSVRPGGRRHRR
jgi:anti-sigma B factor antagonist